MRPVRLQLSRKKGFDLQALSIATNGLPAVNVTRPGIWGNPWSVGIINCGCRSAGECDHNRFRCESAREAVEAFRSWTQSWRIPKGRLGALADIRGKNLACWCAPDAPCHGDVLLEIANQPTSEGSDG